MAGLIDPEKLLSAMKSISNPIYTYHAISRIIESLPTVDIVRCKDCKYYNAGFECLKEGYGIEYPQDWYCADGERREDAEI